MKYITNACSKEHLHTLLNKNIDGVIIGESLLSLRLPFTYEIEEFPQVVQDIKAANKAVYIDMHTMITNDLLSHVQDVFESIRNLSIDGIYFADPSIYQIAKEMHINTPLILSTETTTTNWYGVEYWSNKGISSVALAKELTKKAIRSISKNIVNEDVTLEIQGFGPLAMFHSRRNLLNNYYEHLASENKKVFKGNSTFLFDSERKNMYQIFEDASGTHILSPKDICLIDELNFIYKTPKMTTVKLDCLGHDEIFMNQVIDQFIEARRAYEMQDETYNDCKAELQQNIAALYPSDFRGIDKGFLNKPTIY